jgi:hypothetical protein
MKLGLETYLHTLQSAWRFNILYGKKTRKKNTISIMSKGLNTNHLDIL